MVSHISRYVRLLILTAAIAGCSGVPETAYAEQVAAAVPATLHFISIADSKDATIGEGAAANAKQLAAYAKQVATITTLKLNLVEITGSSFSCQAIEKAVSQLAPGSDDVVVFYYSGHGFAPTDAAAMSRFPWLYCGPVAPFPSLENIASRLKVKNARLTIVMADSCNVVMPISAAAPAAPFEVSSAAQRIRTMFMKYKGSLIVSSSARDEYSWYRKTGGLFTTKLVPLLSDPPSEIANSKLWSEILKKTNPTVGSPSDPSYVLEHPQFDDSQLIYTGT